MAGKTIKCAYCGEAFSSFNPRKINKCRFCGSINYVSDNDQISERFLQAQNRISTYKFNKADEIYFDIFNEAKTTSVKAMALWGRILAYFGVVYIRSSVQEEYVVTFSNYHQEVNDIISFDLVKELLSLDLSQEERKEYQEKIEHLNKEYLLVRQQLSSKKEYDFFICVKISKSLASNNYEKGFTQDSKQAEALYQELTSKGVKVFYSAKSLGGVDSDSQILSALIRSRNIIVISSSLEYLESPWVQSEWRRWINFIDVGQKEKDSFFLYVMNNIELPYVLKERRAQIISSYPTLMELLNEKTNPKSLQEQKNIRDIEENIDKLNEEFNSSKLNLDWCDRLDKIAKRIKELGTSAASISNYSTFEELYKNIKLIRRDLTFDRDIDKLSKIKNKKGYRFAKKVFILDKKIKKNNAIFCQKIDLFNEYLVIAKRKEKAIKGFKIAKRILIPLLIIIALFGIALLGAGYILRPVLVYNYAMEDIKNGNYESAASYLREIRDCTFLYKDIEYYYVISESISGLDEAKNSYDKCASSEECNINYLNYTDTLKFMLDNDFEITVNYDANGGETNMTSEVLTSPSLSATASKNKSRFSGWAIKDFSVPQEKKNEYIATINFVAMYQSEEYQISYDLDGGETKENLPNKYSFGDEVEIPNPTKKGYNFAGWKVNDNQECIKDYKITADVSGNLSLVAVYTPISYKINFILNGGAFDSDYSSIDVEYGSKVSLPIPTLKGNQFYMWDNKTHYGEYVYEEGSPLEITYDFEEDITLEARWNLIEYKITYSYQTIDSKEIINYNPDDLESRTYTIEDTVFLKDGAGGFSHDGYDLVKWIDDQGKEVESIKEGTTGDLHFTGILEPKKYVISFKTNVEEIKNNQISVTFNEEYTIPDYSNYKDGFTIDWRLNGNSFPLNGTYLYPGNAELREELTPKEYNIEYVFNTSQVVDNSTNPTSFVYDRGASLFNISIEGATFDGWYLDGDFKTKVYNYLSPLTYTHDLVLYAKWNHTPYTITFNPGIQNGYVINGETYFYDDLFYKPGYPSNPSYITGGFAGYYLDKDFIHPFKFDQRICEDITLYPKHIPYTYQIGKTEELNSSPTPSAMYFAIPEDATYIISLTNFSSSQRTKYVIIDENGNEISEKMTNYIENTSPHEIVINLEQGKKYGIKAYSADDSSKGSISCLISIKEGSGYPDSVRVGFAPLTVYYLEEFTLPTYYSVSHEIDYFTFEDGTKFEDKIYQFEDNINLIPVLKERTYQIEYDLSGGVNNEKNLYEFTPKAKVTLYEPTKLGYRFIGWYDENNTKVDSIKAGTARNVKLTAKFSANNYNYTIISSTDSKVYVDYDDGNGKRLLEGLNYESGIKLDNPTQKPGYYFTGWSYDETKVKESPSVSNLYLISGEVTFKACYKQITSTNDLYLQNKYTINMKDGLNKNTFIINDNYQGYSTLNIDSMSGNDSITVYLYKYNESKSSSEVSINKPGKYTVNLTNIKRVVFYSLNNNDNQIVFSFSDVNNYKLYSYSTSITQDSVLNIDKAEFERVNPGYEVDCFLYNGNPIDTHFTYGENVTFTIKWKKKDYYQVNYYDMSGNLLDLTKYPGLKTEYRVGEEVHLETILDENNNKLNYYTSKYVSKNYLIDTIPSSNYLDVNIYVDSETQYYHVNYHYLYGGEELFDLNSSKLCENNKTQMLVSESAPSSYMYSYLGYNEGKSISMFSDIDCTQPITNVAIGNTKDIDVYIPCEEKIYNVNFITNHDTISDFDISVKFNEEFELRNIETNDPEKVFIGWKRSDNKFYPASVSLTTFNSSYSYSFTAVYATQNELSIYNLKKGNEVQIGSFPQSRIEDNNLISSLNSYITSYPNLSTGAKEPWHQLIGYDPYFSYYIYYHDVTYNNENYRLVYKIKTSDQTTLSAWFKFEPVVFDVVKKTDNSQSIELVSKFVIDMNKSYNLFKENSSTKGNPISSTFRNSLPTFNIFTINSSLPTPELFEQLDQNSKYSTPEGRIKTATDYATFLGVYVNEQKQSNWYLSKYGLLIDRGGLFDGLLSKDETNLVTEPLAYYLKISI